jgi:FAD/FMN-containing dehydrogenase
MPEQPPVRGTYRDDPRARAAYAEGAGIYRIVPRAVCLPADVEDLQTLVRWAADGGHALVPRGAGSAMGGGNVGDGVVVDLTRLGDRHLAVDPATRRARASAGITLTEINEAAGAHGLRLPPDPSSGRWATVGGMVSTNAAGARSVRYGSVRRWVEGVALVTADGEREWLTRGKTEAWRTAALRRFEREAVPALRAGAALVETRFPRTRKNSSGYALDAFLASGAALDLVIGAEGTLGLVTDTEWRLDPVPAHRAGLRLALADLDVLAETVAALGTLAPSAVELLDRTFLELVDVDGGADAVLLVEFEGETQEALRATVDAAAALVRPLVAAIETAVGAREADRLWALRHAASPILAGLPESRRSLQVVEDGCVPLAGVSAYVRGVGGGGGGGGSSVVLFGHAGDGHIHVNLLPELSRPGWEQAVAGLLDDVTGVLVALGGTPSGEHGDGRLRAGLLERVYGEEVMALFRGIKTAFDPRGIFNPGVILPDGTPPIRRLKAGAEAAPLPDDIAAGLRAIERGGGYARPRLELADQR